MSAEESELDMPVCRRCRIDTRNMSDSSYSSEFRFHSGRWKLMYSKMGACYSLYLCKCSGVPPYPLYVSVCVQSLRNGRIVNLLPEVRRFTTHFEVLDLDSIWKKDEEEILGAIPEFRLHGVLNLTVVLKVKDSGSRFWQTEWSVPEATGPSSNTRSTSVQTTLLMNELPCTDGLTKDLYQLMAEGSPHDVELQCAGLSAKAHKSIVCKRSPVIASMLSTDMAEGRSTGVVTIHMEPDIFTLFMGYIYTGQLEELTFDTALGLYEAGDQYAVLTLAKRCSEFLLEHLSVDNAYEVLVTADAHNNTKLVEKVIDYMVENRVPLVSEEWSAFCDEHSKLANKVLNRAFARAFA